MRVSKKRKEDSEKAASVYERTDFFRCSRCGTVMTKLEDLAWMNDWFDLRSIWRRPGPCKRCGGNRHNPCNAPPLFFGWFDRWVLAFLALRIWRHVNEKLGRPGRGL